MDSVFLSSVSGTPPAAPALPLVGFPRAGNAVTGEKATRPGPYWFHMMTQELRHIVVAGGLTPNASTLNQVELALKAMFVGVSSFTGANQSLGSTGWQRLPGGLILQWGSSAGGVDMPTPGVSINMTFPLAFPSACFQAVGTLLSTGGGGANGITASSFSQTGCNFFVEEWATLGQGAGVRYIAIGR